MRDNVRTWIDTLKRSTIARRLERCMTCTTRPSLGRVKTEEKDFAIWFCQGCKSPAYGTVQASTSGNVALKVLMELPVVLEIGPAQGVLL